MPKKANPSAMNTKNPKIFNKAKKKFQNLLDKDGKIKPIIQKKLKNQLFGDKNRKKKIKQAIDNDPRILKIIERKVAKGFKQESIMKDKRIKKYTKQIKDSFNINYDIPVNFIWDNKNKKLLKAKGKEFKLIASSRPNSIITNKSQIVDYNSESLILRKKALTKKGKKVKEAFGNYELKGNTITKKPLGLQKATGDAKTEPKETKAGLVIEKVYNLDNLNYDTAKELWLNNNLPSQLNTGSGEDLLEQINTLELAISRFVDTIKYYYLNDFSAKERSGGSQRVVLRFDKNGVGGARFFNIDQLDDLYLIVDGFRNKSNDYGSDNEGSSKINPEDLDMSWFKIFISGSHLLGGGGTAKVDCKYWYCIQPRTDFNCCLDGAINKGLGLKKTYKSVRGVMTKNYNIELGEMVTFNQLHLYEDEFKVCLDIYDDTPHYDNDNCIRKSKKSYDNKLQILYKEEHFALIDKPKFKINELTTTQKRKFGLYKKKKGDVLKFVDKTKPKDKVEKLVIFDIETVFDRYNCNFLKTYGVSWVVWDKDKPFNYNAKEHLNEPYTYYAKGQHCLRKLIRFLINPPEGVKYRPIGFNNSRFDNFALCGEATKMGVLNNVFMADGSILYCSLMNCANTWDASRFLPGQSLAGACKSYKTSPQKAVDLIDHYEIQCYFEKNGWTGLTKLLDDRPALVEYNKIDCLCLLDLVLKMRNAYTQLFNEDIFDYLTISSMGYKVQTKLWDGTQQEQKEIRSNEELTKLEKVNKLQQLQPKFHITKPKTYEDDLFFRKSLTAGRTQSFYGKLDYKGELAMGDIKSLYPTVMGNYGGNDCPMPYGDYHYTKEYRKDKLGIYNVNIKHQRCKWKNQDIVYKQFQSIKETTGYDLFRKFAPNVIPKRTKDEPLDWFIKGEIKDINLTSVDIDVLRWATEDDECIEIIEGYYWDEVRRDLFTDFLDPPRLEKTKQDKLKEEDSSEYNVAIREGCKAISNCLSGKLLECIHEDITDLFSLKNYLKMEEKEGVTQLDIQDYGGGLSFISAKRNAQHSFEDMKTNKKKPCYLGMFVYSYARKLMYQKILSRYISLYMDTDSACMPMTEWNRLVEENKDKDFVDNGEYGCIEEEVCYTDKKTGIFYPATRMIAISPKNYCVLNETHDFMSKRKFKGVRKNDYFCPLTDFGLYTTDENNKIDEKSPAYINIRSKTQDQIRSIREFKCCRKCINKVIINKEDRCTRCKKAESKVFKAYSTKMFEYLVKEEKIAVFCSMINRINHTISKEEHEWQFAKKTQYGASVEELEHIMRSNNIDKDSVQLSFKLNDDNFDKELIETKKLENCFKLKQSYLIKII